jgi:hypothetical protein
MPRYRIERDEKEFYVRVYEVEGKDLTEALMFLSRGIDAQGRDIAPLKEYYESYVPLQVSKVQEV